MKPQSQLRRIRGHPVGYSTGNGAPAERQNSHRTSSVASRAARVIPLLALLFLHGSAFAEVAQPPLIDGKPAFLLPDFAIDRTLPNLGTEPPAKAPGSAQTKTDDATKAKAPPPRLTWRAISPTNDVFLERAPGELQ